jgi:hypothetical protein
MKSKSGFIFASIVIPVAAIIVGFTNKEIRCLFRLDSEEICQASFIEVELIVQAEDLKPLENVEVRFITKGAPEVRSTDSNGYQRLQIPRRKDVELIFSKKGFETLRSIINLGNDSDRTRTYRLKKLDPSSSSALGEPLKVSAMPTFPMPPRNAEQPTQLGSPSAQKDTVQPSPIPNPIQPSVQKETVQSNPTPIPIPTQPSSPSVRNEKEDEKPTSSPAQSSSSSASSDGSFFTIVGSYQNPEEARVRAKEIKSNNPDLNMQVFNPYQGSSYYAVMAATWTSKEKAMEICSIARRKGIARDAYVWSFSNSYIPCG